MSTEKWYAVDRVGGGTAVLIDDAGGETAVPLERFATPPKEGSVLRVTLDDLGFPQWYSAKPDDAEKKRRLDEAETAVEDLRERDPGGDIP